MRIIIMRNMPPPPSRVDRPLSEPADGCGPTARTRASPPRTTSRDLLGAGGELVIAHDGREYRLRITQNNRLILTA
jgi:hemin uptake protein HemP